jgi:hypothetical protein
MTARYLDVCLEGSVKIRWLPVQFGLPSVAVKTGNEVIAEPQKGMKPPRVAARWNHYCGRRMGEVRVDVIGNRWFSSC